MTIEAGRWLRVSSGGQDEANQEPDVDRHCAARGYHIGRTYRVHAKSAFHGAHQADLDAVLADMRAGVISVLVIWHSDRLERRPGKALLDVLAEFQAAGGRVESVQEPTLGGLDFGSQITTFVAGLVNHEKSAHLAQQVRLSHDRIRANGKLTGRPPWGYETAGGEKYSREITPTAQGRRYIPQIFRRVIDGDSLARIGAWLRAEGVRPRAGGVAWSPTTIGQIIRCSTYTGRRTDAAGAVIMRCEALVTAETFAAAGQALASRNNRRGDARQPARPVALLTGVARCARCYGPMYRIGAGDGYYRCSASPRFGAERRSTCANMIPVPALDAAVRELLSASREPATVQTWIAGDSTAQELADVAADIAALQAEYNSGALELSVYVGKLTGLDERKRELTARTPVAGHYEPRPTGRTYGEMAAGMDDAGLRSLLLGSHWVMASSRTMPDVNLISVSTGMHLAAAAATPLGTAA